MNVKDDFFTLSTQLKKSSVYAPALNTKDGACLDLYRGLLEDFTMPIIFQVSFGWKFNDIIDTTCGPVILISDKLKTILEKNHFTGWKTYPAILLDKHGREVTGYHGLSITGTCGPVKYGTNKVIDKTYPSGEIAPVYIGITVTDWGGSDFFRPKGSLYIFVTEKVADTLKKNKISNLELEHSKDYAVDDYFFELHLKKLAKEAAEPANPPAS